MLRLLTAEQTRKADQYTIANKPIASIDLMESASTAFIEVFIKRYPDRNKTIAVFCGTGNNGGDGLAVARLLKEAEFLNIRIFIARFSGKETVDFNENLKRFKDTGIEIIELYTDSLFPVDKPEILIDALLGSGINKPLAGDWKKLVEQINAYRTTVVSVDIPTGFLPEGAITKDSTFINADLVVTFQRPKLNFLLPESSKAVKDFEVVEIGLDEEYIQSANSSYFLLTEQDITERLEKRERFSHKGTYGHALIIAGKAETMGAALLCCEACLNAGAGLTTASIPASGLVALNTRCPEVMSMIRNEDSLVEIDREKYQSIAIGPGLGTSSESEEVIKKVVEYYKKPVVFDADGLNVLSENPDLLSSIPSGSILTPHVKEFDRLFGKHESWWKRLETGTKKAAELDSVIILKNRYTIIFSPQGEVIFNPTGHPAMATGGTGDVLTGILASFLAQGNNSLDAAILGVYLHGKAGQDLANEGMQIVPAGKIVKRISETIGKLIA